MGRIIFIKYYNGGWRMSGPFDSYQKMKSHAKLYLFSDEHHDRSQYIKHTYADFDAITGEQIDPQWYPLTVDML